MNSLSTIARARIPAPSLTDYPEEFDPIELFRLARAQGWTAEQFATVFGCEPDTVYKWKHRGKFCRLARIRAATVKKERGF